MTEKIENQLEKVRFKMLDEINKVALKLNGKVKSDFPNTIPIEFTDEILRLSGGLRSYPFLKINKNEVFLVFADEDHQEEYLNAYKNGSLEMKFDEVKKIMQKYGRYDFAQTGYQRFKADSNRFNKAESTVEYLHILEKF